MMRDKLIEIIGDALIESMGDHSAVADAFLAALPGMIPDLVFVKDETAFSAITNFGEYRVAKVHGEWMWFFAWMPKSNEDKIDKGYGAPNTPAAAKASANAHHRAAVAKAAGWTTC